MRLLFWLLVGYVVIRMLQRKPVASKVTAARDETEALQDPVCGMYVSSDEAIVGRYNGERFYFCSEGCLEKFRERLETKDERREE